MRYDVISPHRSICAGCERPKATWGGEQVPRVSSQCSMCR